MPRLGTSFSLPNQRSAARAFDLWLASVFAFIPTRAWCRRPIGKRAAVQRAGMMSNGLSIALAIWRNEQSHCERVRAGRLPASSIAFAASAKEGSSTAFSVIWDGVHGAQLCTRPRCNLMYFWKMSTVYRVYVLPSLFLILRIDLLC